MNSPHRLPVLRKSFHLMTSSCKNAHHCHVHILRHALSSSGFLYIASSKAQDAIAATWWSWRLKLPAIALFVQPVFTRKYQEAPKLRVIGPLWGESTSDFPCDDGIMSCVISISCISFHQQNLTVVCDVYMHEIEEFYHFRHNSVTFHRFSYTRCWDVAIFHKKLLGTLILVSVIRIIFLSGKKTPKHSRSKNKYFFWLWSSLGEHGTVCERQERHHKVRFVIVLETGFHSNW